MQIKEILTYGGLKHAQIVAGAKGADRKIDSISVLEVAESTISTWVVKNQLYITSFYAIKNDVKMQKIVIETLNRSGCCGLVICHLQMILGEAHPDIIALCDALDFPLIVADTEVSYVEILNPIIARLSGTKEQKADEKARTEFLDFLLEEKELPEILERISYNIRHEVSFYDVQCNCLYSNKGDLEKAEERKYLQEHIPWEKKKLSVLKYQVWEKDAGKYTMLYYIKSKKNFFGVIMINYMEEEKKEEILETANNMNLVCALLFSRKRRLYNIEYSYRREFISDLLVWNFRSTEVAVSRGRELGILLEDKKYIVVVNVNAIQKTRDEKEIEELNHYIRHWFMPNITKYVKDYHPDGIAHYRSDVVILLLPDEPKPGALYDLTEQLMGLFENNTRTTISIGVSSSMGKVTDIPNAYNEAFDSAVMGRRYCGENKRIYYKDLWLLCHLKQLRSQPEMQEISTQILGSLYEYDANKGTNLVRTLQVLFECQMDVSGAAERLFIHRNTLLYRKNQIAEVLGCPAFEIPYLLNLMAAVILDGQ